MPFTTSSAAVATEVHAGDAALRARLLAWGLLLLRVVFGLVLFTNGASKLFGFKHLHPLPGFLIDYNGARNIIQANVQHHPIEPYKRLVLDVFVPHWGFFGHAVGAGEFVVGAGLMLGVFTPLLGLIGFLMMVHIWFSRWGQGDADFVWDYWVEFIPYLVLALTSAGRYFGLDRLLAARVPRLRRWPLT